MCNETILTDMGPSAVHCDDSTCAGKTFTCSGPYSCELDCNAAGSCAGTTLKCGGGPCRLKCAMMACGAMGVGPTLLDCGNDACDTTYYQPGDAGGPPVQQTCNGSCKCTHTNEGA
jgi:hypothetical protein